LSISEAGRRLRDGSLTSTALTRAHLERIATTNPALHAFVTVTEGQALAAAAEADASFARGIDRGPFQGIPVAFKDLIDVAGTATACGSRLRARHLAAEDAEVVRRLRAAGAVPLGKLATYEFGLVGPDFDGPAPPAANPWNLAHVTGGSSSGSAAAVAAGMVRTTISTDTGGSIRSPAAYCGVVGLKPTFGRVPVQGVFPVSPSLDCVGPLSATVAEAAMTLDAIAVRGCGAASELGQGVAGLSLAYARDWFARDSALMPEILVAMDQAVAQLARLGARVDEVAMPDYAPIEAAGAVILHAESLDIHRVTLREQGHEYGRLAYQSLAAGLQLTRADLDAARRMARTLRRSIDARILARHDALVTVTTLATAPPLSAFAHGEPVWTPMRTLPFNVTGHPALALPIGFAGGLPIGMQIVGPAAGEALICRIGEAFERTAGYATRRPPLFFA
jgi:aspartyl-tRNA(Asn)/glutamyl-tRNA(Gln) amidotransferase subunit A